MNKDSEKIFGLNDLFKSNFIDNSGDSSHRALKIEKKENENEIPINTTKPKRTDNKITENLDDNDKNKNDYENNKPIKKKEPNLNDIINNNVKSRNKNINGFNTENKVINQNSTLLKINETKFKEKEKKGDMNPIKNKNKNDLKYNLIPDNTKEFFDKEYIERFYIVKFFENITSTIEVRNEESVKQIVIFTKLPEMIYLSNGTKDEFVQNVNRDSEISKKNDLVRSLE